MSSKKSLHVSYKITTLTRSIFLILQFKNGRRQLLYYVSLIRACNKVLYQLVYIGKKFYSLKRTLVFNEPVGPDNVKNALFTMWFQDLANSL